MKRILKFVMIAILVVLMAALFGFVVKGLWNWLTPPLFGFKTIGYWQAVGLVVLTRLLFGGFRGPGRRCGYRRNRMKERWEQMTPEERERLRDWFQTRWGRATPPDAKSSV